MEDRTEILLEAENGHVFASISLIAAYLILKLLEFQSLQKQMQS